MINFFLAFIAVIGQHIRCFYQIRKATTIILFIFSFNIGLRPAIRLASLILSQDIVAHFAERRLSTHRIMEILHRLCASAYVNILPMRAQNWGYVGCQLASLLPFTRSQLDLMIAEVIPANLINYKLVFDVIIRVFRTNEIIKLFPGAIFPLINGR